MLFVLAGRPKQLLVKITLMAVATLELPAKTEAVLLQIVEAVGQRIQLKEIVLLLL